MIPGPTFCCFVCFPLCLEHPCNFAFGIPIPNALKGRLDVSAMQLPKKCDCTGLGNANFGTKLLCCYCGTRFRQWNIIFLLNRALKLYQFVLTFFGVRVPSYPRYFFNLRPRHPPHQSHWCLPWCGGLCGWLMFATIFVWFYAGRGRFLSEILVDTHGCGNFI